MKLEDRVAIVTGASTGIGLAIAEAFAREGAQVVLAARSLDRLERASQKIVESGGDSVAISADVSQEDDVQRLVNGTIERFGRIDILVNNAALNHPPIDIADFDPDLWRSIIDVNLTGAYLCCRAVLPDMSARKSGKIINISSIGGRKGSRGRGAYRASKAGLISLTETLASEVQRIRHNRELHLPRRRRDRDDEGDHPGQHALRPHETRGDRERGLISGQRRKLVNHGHHYRRLRAFQPTIPVTVVWDFLCQPSPGSARFLVGRNP